MTLSEFRAWLAGFSDAVGETPTPAQWAKLQEKLASVYDAPAQPAYPLPLYPQYPIFAPATTCGSGSIDALSGQVFAS